MDFATPDTRLADLINKCKRKRFRELMVANCFYFNLNLEDYNDACGLNLVVVSLFAAFHRTLCVTVYRVNKVHWAGKMFRMFP